MNANETTLCLRCLCTVLRIAKTDLDSIGFQVLPKAASGPTASKTRGCAGHEFLEG